MIKPTVGRVVWFHPAANSQSANFSPIGMYAGIIAFVHSDHCVNLGALDAKGVCHSKTSVPLIQDDESPPERGYYCEWMPYQKAQAAKAQALEPAASASTAAETGQPISNDRTKDAQETP
jgi:hypothetical protein